MRTLLLGLALVSLCVGTAQGLVLTIQDATDEGNDPRVQDSQIRAESTNYPNEDDYNYGASPDFIWFTDDGPWVNRNKYGPRHPILKFDTSYLEGLTNPVITSAKFGFHICPKNSSRFAFSNLENKLSMFLGGKDWIEGTGTGVAIANDGEPTWNSRSHNLNPAWDVAGATAPTDIDLATTKTFDVLGTNDGVGYTGELRYVELDVTDFVQAWVSGTAENNGMIIWGGHFHVTEGTTGHDLLNYWRIISSENPGGEAMKDELGNPIYIGLEHRPKLIVEYIPEPASLTLLALGFAPFLRRRK